MVARRRQHLPVVLVRSGLTLKWPVQDWRLAWRLCLWWSWVGAAWLVATPYGWALAVRRRQWSRRRWRWPVVRYAGPDRRILGRRHVDIVLVVHGRRWSHIHGLRCVHRLARIDLLGGVHRAIAGIAVVTWIVVCATSGEHDNACDCNPAGESGLTVLHERSLAPSTWHVWGSKWPLESQGCCG